MVVVVVVMVVVVVLGLGVVVVVDSCNIFSGETSQLCSIINRLYIIAQSHTNFY